MSALAHRRFLKMHGAGNAIVVLDLRGSGVRVAAAEARAIAADPSSSFDQLMVLHDPRSRGTDAFMRIYNTDGSESGACGNGTRCVAYAMLDDPAMARPVETGRLVLETDAGRVEVKRVAERSFTVDMGRPRLAWNEIPLRDPFPDTRRIELQIGPIDDPILHSPGAVNMGNPHAVFFTDRDPDTFDLGQIGPMLENHPIFPERANISIAQVRGREAIKLRVWERGAGLTLACGTAACAAVVAASRLRMIGRQATVSLPGGELFVEWRADDHVLMTGPVCLVAEGRFAPELFAQDAA
ncbi:diaminopimelate epimerase [Methylobacterium sp. E-041]|jgi:diaminopimelate epimerase|uniref:diaminopimelate epimerase n=1 Tax=unclassified Methylobacterium TaxID=2615210 RepID=UPI0011C74A64|nr:MULTISPECIES: diaminopimelate epimerase [unclassified Methylobacterium]MCJ2009053.1 diaminopimelate epimerase [Methylobacterium sp. J-092]MCJ2039684.1 diaminopimelate epimerase [Methylobacterium sp. J-059]MCJ2077211.1 diaminopimelate epimerase [Methylobacterium sp. E-016]MCJ2105873.1 diaminopimelate epimerase [Methylobacterium sp. E-041]MCJ2113875.1 diaminopimelate epimerase [Methylobacterium sp. E-025]